MKYIQKLYLAHTDDKTLFVKDENENKKSKPEKKKFRTSKVTIPEAIRDTIIDKLIAQHHPIKISLKDKLNMFFTNKISCKFCCLKTFRQKQLAKLYKEGSSRY